MDIFGFKKRRKQRHEEFINTLSNQSDEYLIDAWMCLDSDSKESSDEYTRPELRAVEKELDKRGYVDDMGYVIPHKKVCDLS